MLETGDVRFFGQPFVKQDDFAAVAISGAVACNVEEDQESGRAPHYFYSLVIDGECLGICSENFDTLAEAVADAETRVRELIQLLREAAPIEWWQPKQDSGG